MRLFIFAERYPASYKPYYDSQFADLIHKGHDITIFAHHIVDRPSRERYRHYELGQRIRRYPTTLRTLPQSLPTMAAASLVAPRRVLVALRATAGTGRNPKRRVTDLARAVAVQVGQPNVCLIHELATGAWFTWLGRVFPGVPVALYYHGGEVPSVPDLPPKTAAEAFAAVDVVFTNTQSSAQQAVSRGCAPEKIVILPVGFAFEDFVPDVPRRYRRDGILRLLSVGRLSEEKGLRVALQAVKMLVVKGNAKIHYSLVGEGYLRRALERYVQENALSPHVTFMGTLTRSGVIQAMKDADALLQPSIALGNWIETQACTVQEAMLLQTLVVTTRAGGVPESIPPAMQPWSVPPEDPHALAAAIAEIQALSDSQIRALGKVCRSFVLQRYDIRKLNAEMLDVIRGVTTGTRFVREAIQGEMRSDRTAKANRRL